MATKSKGTDQTASAQCFFITPIGDTDSAERRRADWLFHMAIEPACKKHGLKPERADIMSASAMIGTNIFRAISEAPICIADLTGLNPNVLYEMGVRHTLRKPIVHIAQVGTRLPFDTAAHLTHFYDLDIHGSIVSLADIIEADMERMLDHDYEVSNPFTQALGSIQLSQSDDPKDQLIARLDERLRVLEASRSVLRPQRVRNALAPQVSPEMLLQEVQRVLNLRESGHDVTIGADLTREVLGANLFSDPAPVTTMYGLITESDLPNRTELEEAIRDTFPESISAFRLRGL
jgi:hypothetical protein